MRVCIVGCGAVGSLFAANLATLDDVEVWAYDLAREHVDAINRDGLRLTGRRRRGREGAGDGRRGRAARRATSGSSRRRRCTPRPRSRRPRTRSRAAASPPVQNGIGNEEVLARHVERVIRGTTFPAGKMLEPGVVQWDVKGDTTLGPFEPQPAPAAEIERLAEACTRAGMPTKAVADARGPQWRKVIFNAATNPVGALTGLTHGAVCEQPPLRRLASQLVDEGRPSPPRRGSSSTPTRRS